MSSNSTSEVFFALCKGIDTPRSLGAWLRMKYGEERQLSELTCNPDDYNSPDSFFCDYVVSAFLSKSKDLDTGVDTRAEALRRFATAEEQCKLSNERIRSWAERGQNPRLSGVFHAAQRKIAKLLGPFSIFCVDGGERWGPHAALDVARREAFVDTKMTKLPISVSLRSRWYLKSIIERDLHWSAAILGSFPEGPFSLLPHVFELREEARIETVPKSARTDRVIAVEPRGNGFLQKSVGSYIRAQLRKVGINLNDQSRNADAARRGVADQLATLDLSAASDTICKEIVFNLLPLDWAQYLDDLRTHSVTLDGSALRLQKFSAMGNGFTFELETLIFWALTKAAVESLSMSGEVLVYGDDIVCPIEASSLVIDSLVEAGFKVNEEKSFVHSNFRESCGSHYFAGVDVKPVYQKEPISSSCEAMRAGNRLFRLALRSCEGLAMDHRFFPAWSACRRLFPESHPACIPYTDQGDDGWLSFEVPGRYDPNKGYRCIVSRRRERRLPGDSAPLLAYALRTLTPSSDDKGRADDLSVPTDETVWTHRWVHASTRIVKGW